MSVDRVMMAINNLRAVTASIKWCNEGKYVLLPMTRSQRLLHAFGFARFRWFRRRVGGRWCYRQRWINDYPHSSNMQCIAKWERHPTPTMGPDVLEVEQYDSREFPVARLVDKT